MYLCILYLSENKQRLVPLTAKLIGFYNRDEKCLLRGTNWIFKYSNLHFVFKGLICWRIFYFTNDPQNRICTLCGNNSACLAYFLCLWLMPHHTAILVTSGPMECMCIHLSIRLCCVLLWDSDISLPQVSDDSKFIFCSVICEMIQSHSVTAKLQAFKI